VRRAIAIRRRPSRGPAAGSPERGHDLLVDLLVDQRGGDDQHARRNGHERVTDLQRPQQDAYTQCEGSGDHEDEAEPQGGEAHRDRRVVRHATQEKQAPDESHDDGQEGRHAV
jgi:hypothetical protein